MYSIEMKPYGYRIVFGGSIDAAEMRSWLMESKVILQSAPREFCVFVDMRTLAPLKRDARPLMAEGQKLYKKKGMLRSVVILNNISTTQQFRRIAIDTGVAQWERYIDAGETTRWEEIGMAWLTREAESV